MLFLAYDVTPGSKMIPCIKIDTPLMVLQIFGDRYEITHMVKH